MTDAPRDHGGDLAAAMARYGGSAAEWIDLSTGINRAAYPAAAPSARALRALPDRDAYAACAAAARMAYGGAGACLPLAGAQAAIRLIPRLRPPGRCAILSPTYNEHAAAFAAEGWTVDPVGGVEALAGAEAAVIVNPNNPDGRAFAPETLRRLASEVELLLVDESFGDVAPALSLAPHCGAPGLIVLRSLGKFYGLAGLRLGFALGAEEEIAALAELAGPWPVSGPALELGAIALGDADWAAQTRARLTSDAARLDSLAPWTLVGGADLFRLYETGDAAAAQARLARHRIWSRIFPYSPGWLRLGLPGDAAEWARLEAAWAQF